MLSSSLILNNINNVAHVLNIDVTPQGSYLYNKNNQRPLIISNNYKKQ